MLTAVEVIDGRIARYRALIEELTAVRAELATAPPAAPPAPRGVAPGVPEARRPGKERPAAERQPAQGESPQESNAEKIATALQAAGKALTCSEAAKAAGLTYNAAYLILTGSDQFSKSPSGKYQLAPHDTSTSSESGAEGGDPAGGGPGT